MSAVPIIGVYKAKFAYTATSDQELNISEGDVLYVLEKADDGWWTVKRRMSGSSDVEPTGLVPHNFVEPAPTIGTANALYPYERQNDEELSFQVGVVFDVFIQDGDWVLVGKNDTDFGFVPANYIEMTSGKPPPAISKVPPPKHPSLAAVAASPAETSPVTATRDGAPRQGGESPPKRSVLEERRPSARSLDDSEEEAPPPKPPRPTASNASTPRSNSAEPGAGAVAGGTRSTSSQGRSQFKSWAVQEVDGRSKRRATLAINNWTIMLTPEKGAQQEWDVQDLLSYSSEKKHVFLELQHPRASVDLRVNSQDIGDQILAGLGQVAGAKRGSGLTEVLVAAKSAGQREGKMALDFRAVSAKEVSVLEGETVFVLNQKDKQWWLVRTSRGEEGIVPAKFVDLVDSPTSKLGSVAGALGLRRKNKDEDRAKRESAGSKRYSQPSDDHQEPSRDRDARSKEPSSSRPKKEADRNSAKPRPDPKKVRVWTDRSGTFRVEAALLGSADGKIHLHKNNGVKIAVPANKLSAGDLDYVESVTGVSLAKEKPLVDLNKDLRDEAASGRRSPVKARPSVSESRKGTPQQEGFDWFQFFLDAGVDVNNCQRYALNFTRDKMDESVLPEITPQVLRTLGLREGDILRVTKKISEKYGHAGTAPSGGLFTGPEGSLKNNTSKTQLPLSNEDAWTPRDEVPPVVPASSQPPASVPTATSSVQPSSSAPASQALRTQPTGSLAELMGYTPLQPQKTAESQLAEKQAAQQREILKQQGELQQQQLQLLKQQQEQLKKQQEDLAKLQQQRTGPMQALGPFATGVAQLSTGSFGANSAAMGSSVLANPASAVISPQAPFGISQATLPLQPTVLRPTTTGPGAQFTGSVAGSQPTGPFAPALTGQRTGPFGGSAALPQQTGPFAVNSQPTGSFAVQSQPTRPFSVQPQAGPFVQNQPTGPFVQNQPTGPFAQNQQAGPFVQNQQTGPFVQAQQTGPLVQNQQTGPFVQNQQTGPFAPQAQLAGPFAQYQPNVSGTFGTQVPQSGPFLQGGPFSGQSNGLSGQRTGPDGGFSTLPVQQSSAPPKQNDPFASLVQSSSTGTSFGGANVQPLGLQSTRGQQTLGQMATGNAQYGQTAQAPFVNSQAQPNVYPGTQFQPTNVFGVNPNPFGQISAGPTPGQFGPVSGNQPQQPSMNVFQGQTGSQAGPFGNNFTQAMAQSLPQFQPQASMQPQVQTQSVGGMPLQNQPTGFGFGNQPLNQSQTGGKRPNLMSASANNPFGF